MRLSVCPILAMVLCAGVMRAQQAGHVSSPARHPQLTSAEMIRRVFDGEQATIATFAKSHPIVETYLQSLQLGTGGDPPMDDAYFLSKVEVNVDPGRVILQQFLFGSTENDRKVRIESGLRWPLNPPGYVEMLFVDLADFNDDYYKLSYEGEETVGEVNCARFSAVPRDSRAPGRFVGEIWAETSSFRIVRFKGIFSPHRPSFLAKYLNARGISGIGLYLHFESWRQEVAPGVWVPSYVYFDEEREGGHRTGDLSAGFHYRGHVFVWGYQPRGQDWEGSSGDNTTARVSGSLLPRLEDNGLLAKPAEVERSLTAVLRGLLAANDLPGSAIECRVLLTTPVELFSVGRTVVVSRGLLNMMPNESVLTVLLAHELAHILLGHTQAPISPAPKMFVSGRGTDFPGLGVTRSAAEESAATAKMGILLDHPQYANAISETEVFLSRLAVVSSQVPNLVRGRFGIGLVREGKVTVALPNEGPIGSQTVSSTPLELRGQYGIDPWSDRLVMLPASRLDWTADQHCWSWQLANAVGDPCNQ